MPAAVTKASGKFVLDEPVAAASGALWIVANAGTFLVGRTHLLTSQEWSATASWATPFVTAAVLAVFAWVVRKVVTPAWKFIESEGKKIGIDLPDLEIATDAPVLALPSSTPIDASMLTSVQSSISSDAPVLAPDDPTATAANGSPDPLVLNPVDPAPADDAPVTVPTTVAETPAI